MCKRLAMQHYLSLLEKGGVIHRQFSGDALNEETAAKWNDSETIAKGFELAYRRNDVFTDHVSKPHKITM